MFLATPESTEAVERVYQTGRDAHGFVMNLARAWAWRPDVFEAFGALRSQLTSQSSLTKRDLAVIVCATASARRDSYCSIAWGKSLAAEASPAIAAAVLSATEGEGVTARDRALAAWARQVVVDPNATTSADLDALRAAGFSDRDIFEITTFVAFRLAFATVNDALGAAPDWQLFEASPKEVAAAVSYGRPAGPRTE
jgi:uncharacterized peroxidase-related enzyme